MWKKPMRSRTKIIVTACALALLASAGAAGWRLQQSFADQTYEMAASAAGADHPAQAMTLLKEACEEGSRRACDILRDGGGPGAILH